MAALRHLSDQSSQVSLKLIINEIALPHDLGSWWGQYLTHPGAAGAAACGLAHGFCPFPSASLSHSLSRGCFGCALLEA